jgi:hypothetical protein
LAEIRDLIMFAISDMRVSVREDSAQTQSLKWSLRRLKISG